MQTDQFRVYYCDDSTMPLPRQIYREAWSTKNQLAKHSSDSHSISQSFSLGSLGSRFFLLPSLLVPQKLAADLAVVLRIDFS